MRHNGREMALEGAEAILELRAVIASGDFDAYGRSTSAASTNASTTRDRDSLVLAA